MDTSVSLHTLDYIVVAIILFVCLGIGVLFAVKDFKNVSRIEYLFGGRRMAWIPVALSIFATTMTAISYIGATTDIYMYGAMTSIILVGFGVGYLVGVFTFVPLLYQLRLTSIYHYLQLRFDSTAVRLFAVIIGMLQTLCFMSLALLAPSLALQTGVGMPLWISVGAVGFIGTVYTAIGGIKSVVWTDAFQSFIMLFGALTMIIKGNSLVGGGNSVWKIAQAGGRTSFNEFSFDPRVRNSWWGSVIGGIVLCLVTVCSQSSLQRISAMKSINDVKNAYWLNFAIMLVHGSLLLGIGWTMYAYFAHIRCDPFQAGYIVNTNQLTVYFVMHALRDMPGIGGVFLATLFSASLSTISSGINSLAAITVEDLLKKPLQNVQESTATFITKVLVIFFGFLIIGLAYLANSVPGPLVQITISSMGALGGPLLGCFLLASLCPWANKYGAFIGANFAMVFNMWIAIGNQMYGSRFTPLPYPPMERCIWNNSLSQVTNNLSSALYFGNETFSQAPVTQSMIIRRHDPPSFKFFLYDISYQWYGFTGVIITFVLGMIISYCSQRYCTSVIDERLLFSCVRKFALSKVTQRNNENNDEETKDMLLSGNDLRNENISDGASNGQNRHQSMMESKISNIA